MLLAIDPGEDTGWALFDGGDLVGCGLGHPVAPYAAIDSFIVEVPRIYPGGKARPNDVVTLALNAGQWLGRFRALCDLRDVKQVHPQQWKGSVPKDIHHARLWQRLTGGEQQVVSKAGASLAPSKRHNVMDAVGLGLFALGRR